ncbi:MAG: T9SS type A sorting domain-containing protein [Chitinophagales bacterium]|nr:T9SS type A sorting domain-containing protein [Chitinophagales bacterium]
MKKVSTLLFLIITLTAFSQNYPFSEGFESFPSGQVPAGWGGSMKVLLNHGVGDEKGLAARVSSAVRVDSSSTPLIGPLTNASAFSFRYRIIDQNIYPSTPTNLVAGDKVEVLLSSDGVNYQTILELNEDNHNPSFNFLTKKIYLAQFAGQTVNFKFRCTYGTGASFYVDIDTVKAFNDVQAGIDGVSNAPTLKVYPNPININTTLHIGADNNLIGEPYKITNALGSVVKAGTLNNTTNTINTANLTAGIYFVQAGNLIRKLIITQ